MSSTNPINISVYNSPAEGSSEHYGISAQRTHTHTHTRERGCFSEVLKLNSLSASAEGHCMPNHCSWSAHCAASLSLPSRSPSSPLPSISSPSSSTVASVGLSSFSIFCMPSRDFWSFGSRLQKSRTVTSAQLPCLRFYRTAWVTLP